MAVGVRRKNALVATSRNMTTRSRLPLRRPKPKKFPPECNNEKDDKKTPDSALADDQRYVPAMPWPPVRRSTP